MELKWKLSKTSKKEIFVRNVSKIGSFAIFDT